MADKPNLAVDWQSVLDQTADLIIITNLDTKIISVNRAAEQLLGYRREDLIGTSMEDYYVDPAERRRLLKLAIVEGSVSCVETQLRNQRGETVAISLTLTTLRDERGAVVGTVGISKDVTATMLLREQRQLMHRVSQKLLAAAFLAAHGSQESEPNSSAHASWTRTQRLLADCIELVREAAGLQPPGCNPP